MSVHGFSSSKRQGVVASKPDVGWRLKTLTKTSINKSNMEPQQVFGLSSKTIEAPTREKTDRVKTGKGTRRSGRDTFDDDDKNNNDDDDRWDYPDLEYLMDPSALRGDEDPFHILLLSSTFEKPKVTVPYVSTALEYVLAMPFVEATELSQFAKDEGMSCLGTWPHEECVSLGKQLQVRDIVCRVVPYCEGGQRGWQAKDAASASSGASSSSE
jgi:hypothetical protein